MVRALSRGGIYRLLGRAFGYRTPSVLAELAPLAEQAAEAPEVTPDLRQHLARLAAAARLLAAWVLENVAALGVTPTRLEGLADPEPAGEDAFTCPMAEPEAGTWIDQEELI